MILMPNGLKWKAAYRVGDAMAEICSQRVLIYCDLCDVTKSLKSQTISFKYIIVVEVG